MSDKVLLSSAYLPPIEYISIARNADKILIENEENYIKQTYRNRCYILSAHGRQLLSVPVYLGSMHKTRLKDIRIDYSKKWQQVHLRAIKASYGAAPYFEYYFDNFEKIISFHHEFLTDLNELLLDQILKILEITAVPEFTYHFEPANEEPYDFRYKIAPKKESLKQVKKYSQVFPGKEGFISNLSIIDLLFNMGPDSVLYL